MNTFGDVAVFVRVAESNSFVRASESMAISASAISKAVKRLESRLGARLLNRTTRAVHLTDVGEEYYERCREALGGLELAESKIAESRGVARGRLRIDVPVTLGRKVVVPALPRFLQQHPELSLQVSMNDRFVDLVQEGIDAAVRVGNLTDSSLIAKRVALLSGTTCASPEFIARHGNPRTPADLKPESCIALFRTGNGHIRNWIFRKDGVEHALTPRAPMMFSDVESAVGAAVRGAGFVRVLSVAVEAQIAAGLLQRVLVDWDRDSLWPVSVVYPRHRQPTAKIRALVDFTTSLFPQPLNE